MKQYICPEDDSTTVIKNGFQTIAGALLKSKHWKKWYRHAQDNQLFDVDETMTIDAMSDEHFDEFIKFIKR